MTKLSYLKPTSFIHQSLLDEIAEGFPRSGLYNWLDIFKGDIRLFHDVEDWEKYDVIHLNASASDFHQVNRIRNELRDSSTKLVVSLDYGIHEWQTVHPIPDMLFRELNAADAVFGTEQSQVDAARIFLGDKVCKIPHPVSVKLLKEQGKTAEPEEYVSVLYHVDGNHTTLPWLATRNLDLKVALIGYVAGKDPTHSTTMVLYDRYRNYTSYKKFLGYLGWSKIVYEPYFAVAWGRAIADIAGYGRPAVASSMVEASEVCFPQTT